MCFKILAVALLIVFSVAQVRAQSCPVVTVTQTRTPTLVGGTLLELTKIADPSVVLVGDPVTFSLIYKNNEPVPGADIVWIIDGSGSMGPYIEMKDLVATRQIAIFGWREGSPALIRPRYQRL